jgi:hypothetical protein
MAQKAEAKKSGNAPASAPKLLLFEITPVQA